MLISPGLAKRIKFNGMPTKVKKYVAQGFLDEGHIEAISSLVAPAQLSPWLTTSQAWEELAEKAVHD